MSGMILANKYSDYSDLIKLNKIYKISGMIIATKYSAYSDLKKLNKMLQISAMILANNSSAYSDLKKTEQNVTNISYDISQQLFSLFRSEKTE